MTRQDCSPHIRRQPRPGNTIGQHDSGRDNDVRIGHHVLLDGGEISRIWQEVVVEEHDDVSVRRGFDHSVALSRQTRLNEQDKRAGACCFGTLYVSKFGTADDDAVGSPCLSLDLTQRLTHDGSPSDGRYANRYSALHSANPLCLYRHECRPRYYEIVERTNYTEKCIRYATLNDLCYLSAGATAAGYN